MYISGSSSYIYLYIYKSSCQLDISTWVSQPSQIHFQNSFLSSQIPKSTQQLFSYFNKWQLYSTMSEIWYILCHVRNRALILDFCSSIILTSNFVHFTSVMHFLNLFTSVCFPCHQFSPSYHHLFCGIFTPPNPFSIKLSK